MNLVVEYLIVVEKPSSPAFFHICQTEDAFNTFLQSNRQDIEIDEAILTYRQHLSVAYHIAAGAVENKEQRFLHLTFTYAGNEDPLDEYTHLLKTVKTIIHNAGGQPETLWNDISFYYSKKAYPLIHQIENRMRKLIAYFMLTTIGKEWISFTSPSAVKEAIDKSKRKQYLETGSTKAISCNIKLMLFML